MEVFLHGEKQDSIDVSIDIIDESCIYELISALVWQGLLKKYTAE